VIPRVRRSLIQRVLDHTVWLGDREEQGDVADEQMDWILGPTSAQRRSLRYRRFARSSMAREC
jgi:hypothetical protein